MPLPPDQEKQFNEAAQLARTEFEKHWKDWKVHDVAVWWEKWCRMGRTNHDRLGRILLEVTGVRRKPPALVKIRKVDESGK